MRMFLSNNPKERIQRYVMINFKSMKVSDRVTRIYGLCGELMYLVEGDCQAALIDTGSGIGSLRKYIENLTDKPVIVLLTHGHMDHAMGAGEFETVYMNRKDDELYRIHGKRQDREDWICMTAGENALHEMVYIPSDDPERFKNLSEGDVFNLGGVSVEVYSLAGHTAGTLVMLIREEKLLLLGDACNSRTFLFGDGALPVREYHKNLLRIKHLLTGQYETVLSSHETGCLPLGIIDEVISICSEIEAGTADDIPFEFRGMKAFMAKQEPEPDVCSTEVRGNVIYCKENI